MSELHEWHHQARTDCAGSAHLWPSRANRIQEVFPVTAAQELYGSHHYTLYLLLFWVNWGWFCRVKEKTFSLGLQEEKSSPYYSSSAGANTQVGAHRARLSSPGIELPAWDMPQHLFSLWLQSPLNPFSPQEIFFFFGMPFQQYLKSQGRKKGNIFWKCREVLHYICIYYRYACIYVYV